MIEITYLGHSGFLISDGTTRLVIDPFLTGNPLAAVQPEALKVDYVLLTHGHGDHLGDGIQIALANKATVIACYELASYCSAKGCKTHPMAIGGAFAFPFGRVKLTIAHHGSGVEVDGEMKYLGNPCGILIQLAQKTLYHAGDTGLFLDLKLIGAMNSIDVAFLPIGDNFTMGIDDAVKAVEFLHPGLVVPMHFRTFASINTDPAEFADKVQKIGFKAAIIPVGATLTV